MIFPIEDLIRYKGNMYEITVAASRRAYQLSMINAAELQDYNGKAVSLAARQVFFNEVQFKLAGDNNSVAAAGFSDT